MSRLKQLGLILRTLRYLKPVQLWGQVRNRLPRKVPELGSVPVLASGVGEWVHGIDKHTGYVGDSRFRFLNVDAEFHGWWSDAHTYLWYYNLNYFEWLNQTDCENGGDWILRWIRENPPSSENRVWEPYPVSLRITNWIRYFLENGPSESAHESLAFQAEWLMGRIETHLLGNHYLVNGIALVFAGLYFEGTDADQWLKKGWAIVRKELPVEVLCDGGHFERSPMYHSLILEDVLNLLNLARAYPERAPSPLVPLCEETAGRMLSWLSGMTYEDGTFPLFNDAAGGIGSSREDLEAYASRLSVAFKPIDPVNGISYFKDTGFARLQMGAAVLFAEVGGPAPCYQPGHAHAGTLGFELMVAGHRILVDTGTNTYEVCAKRAHQRSTLAHNTVIVAGHGSSETWSSFRMGRRAHARCTSCQGGVDLSDQTLLAEHNGYEIAGLGGVHRREWRLSDGRLKLSDSIAGLKRPQSVEIRFHFAPGIQLKEDGQSWVASCRQVNTSISKQEGFTYEVESYEYCPEFGISVSGQCLIARTVAESVDVSHSLDWSLN